MQRWRDTLLTGFLLVIMTGGNVVAERDVLGYVEYIYLQPWGLKLKARLDTGAKTSSIYAVDIVPFEKDDEEWVSFTMPFDQDLDVDPVHIEKPVARSTLIKRKRAKSVRRYVIEFDICLNGRMLTTEFTLADREGFLYSVLLGRNTLKGNAIVDPAEAFLSTGKCQGSEPADPEDTQ